VREITFDTETTGLDPKTGHRIVEIGCVEIIDKRPSGKSFHRYLNPEREVPKAAEQIHGLSSSFLSDKPLFASIANEFLEFIGDAKLVIHNAAFDIKFINFELEQLGLPSVTFDRTIDTLDMARRKFPGAKATLDALCQRFGISLDRRTKHGALLDAELLAEVYFELCGGAQSSIFFESTASSPDAMEAKKGKKMFRPARPHAPSEEEIVAHTVFVNAKIKEPMWTA